ncbi:MAG: glutamine synthetase [archaeon]|nr:MAG: glutamine synthetase [archaeon]
MKSWGFRNKKEVLDFLEKDGRDIKFINILFSDILGELRGFTIPVSELEKTFEEGKGFDGSSIQGLARIEESDLVAMPDPRTFRVFPWDYENGWKGFRVGLMFCDLLNPDKSHHQGDTRYVLKRTLEKAGKMGFDGFKVGPELEFFYFPDSSTPEPMDKGDYFSMGIGDPLESLRKKTMLALEKMGIFCEYDHHEVAPSQQEIDLRYENALEMADICMLFRFVVKEMARKEFIYATFLPKPVDGENGSGMHVHQSLWKGRRNAFFEAGDEYCLSDTAKQYVAGLMYYINDITSLLNQWINSYKRLVPGYEAPVYHTWGQRNRSALIRIPKYQPGKENATRIELRNPDPACNPYLAFAVMLAAGLRGIGKGYKISKPYETNVYKNHSGLKTLPKNLEEALEITRNSEMVKEVLGPELFRKFIQNKELEIKNYRNEAGNKYDHRVSPYEIEHNLPRL